MLRYIAVISCLLVVCSADAEDPWQQQVEPIGDESPQKKPFTHVEFMKKWGHIVTMTDLKDLKGAKHPADVFSEPAAMPGHKAGRRLLQVPPRCSFVVIH